MRKEIPCRCRLGKKAAQAADALMQPSATEIIAQAKDKQNTHPEETRRREQPGQARAVARMHKINNDDEHLRESDGDGRRDIKAAQIEARQNERQEETCHQE